MKRLIIILAATLISAVSFAQQTTYFGIKLGNKYSTDELISAIGDNGTFLSESVDSTSAIQVKTIVFSTVMIDEEICSKFAWLSLPDNTITSIIFIYDNSDYTTEELARRYQRSFNILSNETDFTKEGTTVPNCQQYSAKIGEDIQVLLDEYTEDNIITGYGITYSNLQTIINLITTDSTNRPSIQAKFMGLEMGKKYASPQIKAAVGSKGYFYKESRRGNDIIYIFTDIYFAGKKWSYGELTTTSNNQLYSFEAYDSLDGIDTDDEIEAKSIFDTLKGKLDSKYGYTPIHNKNSETSATYAGGNQICARIYNHRARSSSGEYRRYVGISYYYSPLLMSQSSINDDEL